MPHNRMLSFGSLLLLLHCIPHTTSLPLSLARPIHIHFPSIHWGWQTSALHPSSHHLTSHHPPLLPAAPLLLSSSSKQDGTLGLSMMMAHMVILPMAASLIPWRRKRRSLAKSIATAMKGTSAQGSGVGSDQNWLQKFLQPILSFDWSLFFCLLFWYLGNYYYNITNKYSLRASGGVSGAPLTIANIELAVGVMYGWFLWLAPDARQLPKTSMNDILGILPLALAFAGNHFSTVLAMSAGAVSFGQIVKASEPVFCALLGSLMYSQTISIWKWLSLIPVIGGVSLACSAELHFSSAALVAGIISNVFAAIKVNENRKAMDMPGLKDRLGSVGNQFAITMTLAWLLSLPPVLLLEWRQLPALVSQWQATPSAAINTLMAGLWFYWHNELATIFVKKTGPVTQSVASTAKRVIVIVACGLVLGESLEPVKLFGCFIGVAGVFLYSIADDVALLLKSKINCNAG